MLVIMDNEWKIIKIIILNECDTEKYDVNMIWLIKFSFKNKNEI